MQFSMYLHESGLLNAEKKISSQKGMKSFFQTHLFIQDHKQLLGHKVGLLCMNNKIVWIIKLYE